MNPMGTDVNLGVTKYSLSNHIEVIAMQEKGQESRVSVRVEPELRAAFYAKAQEEGRTATSVIIDFINQYLGGKTSTSELTELRQRIERIEARQLGESIA